MNWELVSEILVENGYQPIMVKHRGMTEIRNVRIEIDFASLLITDNVKKIRELFPYLKVTSDIEQTVIKIEKKDI